ncbi:unnamed protein product, partial [Sphagnum compactum]
VVLLPHFQASWPSKGHSVGSGSKVHEQVLEGLVEANGVGTQDEHFIPPLNRWTNRE